MLLFADLNFTIHSVFRNVINSKYIITYRLLIIQNIVGLYRKLWQMLSDTARINFKTKYLTVSFSDSLRINTGNSRLVVAISVTLSAAAVVIAVLNLKALV